ncbi:MAG: hypothetical protein KDE48_09730 [Anaerolineales bacterium]|nr:hypothetical protein [Anaerolineales bacterium]
MAHILFICTANICRSPVAEALLKDRLNKRGLLDWTVSSAGTWAQQKRAASQNSVIVAQNLYGLDISEHAARMVELSHLANADLVLCMETGHAEALRFEFHEYADKVFLLSQMVGPAFSIEDPYGGPLKAYESMARELEDIIDRGLDKIIELASANEAQR